MIILNLDQPGTAGIADGDLKSNSHIQQTSISFHLVNDFPGWDKAPEWVLELIDLYGARHILEIGSGANPTLPAATVNARNLRYTVNDENLAELAKADGTFDQWQCDLPAAKRRSSHSEPGNST